MLMLRILILFVNDNFIFGLQLQGRKWETMSRVRKQFDCCINIEGNLTCLLMVAAARQTFPSECVAAGSYWDQNEARRGEN